MKHVRWIALLILGSTPAFALTSDYSCSLVKKNDGQVLLTANALISRSSMVTSEGSGEYSMMVSNHLGYELEVNVYDNLKDAKLISGVQKLAGAGFVDGDSRKGERSDANPKEITFASEDGEWVSKCLRADDIRYPRH